jgi:hypothetical protein
MQFPASISLTLAATVPAPLERHPSGLQFAPPRYVGARGQRSQQRPMTRAAQPSGPIHRGHHSDCLLAEPIN